MRLLCRNICNTLLSDIFELQVIMSLARINWLTWNFGARDDLVSEFHQTVSEGVGSARLAVYVNVVWNSFV